MARILQIRQQVQSIKKGGNSISDFIMKVKNIRDALMAVEENVPDRDLILSLMSSVGHEYDSVIILISSQHQTMSLEDAQFLSLMHEQRIEQLNTSSQLNVSGSSVHFVSNTSNNDRRGQRSGPNSSNNNRGGARGRNGSSEGRYTRSNQRIYCQLCAKLGHSALQCYKRFD
ncbi:hypothetical protein ACOSP7_013293 [Xanthoceras sorbifolium]